MVPVRKDFLGSFFVSHEKYQNSRVRNDAQNRPFSLPNRREISHAYPPSPLLQRGRAAAPAFIGANFWPGIQMCCPSGRTARQQNFQKNLPNLMREKKFIRYQAVPAVPAGTKRYDLAPSLMRDRGWILDAFHHVLFAFSLLQGCPWISRRGYNPAPPDNPQFVRQPRPFAERAAAEIGNSQFHMSPFSVSGLGTGPPPSTPAFSPIQPRLSIMKIVKISVLLLPSVSFTAFIGSKPEK